MAQVWQVGTGDAGRHYDDLFFGHDVMFIGPGDHGPYAATVYENHKHSQIRGFAESVRPGDIVLMRSGREIKHIGVVPEDGYEWQEMFDDVFGWDLQHSRRVVWQDHLSSDIAAMQEVSALFGARKQIPTFTRVHDKSILGPLQSLLSRVRTRPLRALPPPIPKPLTKDQLGEALFSQGLSHEAIERVLLALDRSNRLHRWYRESGKRSGRPSEHEVVAYFVLPLLMALGWSEQQVAIEWKKIDLALFSGTPTTAGNCTLVCEVKGRGLGLREVIDQAAEYCHKLELKQCRALLTTDGTCMFLYTKIGGLDKWMPIPTGYLNVTRIRTENIIARTNGVDTIMKLTPAGLMKV